MSNNYDGNKTDAQVAYDGLREFEEGRTIPWEKVKEEMMTMKLCSGCKQQLPLSEFDKDASKPDGLHTRCKNCKKHPPKRTQADDPKNVVSPSAGKTTKTCASCGKVLPIAMFNKTRKNSDGLHSYCKPCANAYHIERKRAKLEEPLSGCEVPRATTDRGQQTLPMQTDPMCIELPRINPVAREELADAGRAREAYCEAWLIEAGYHVKNVNDKAPNHPGFDLVATPALKLVDGWFVHLPVPTDIRDDQWPYRIQVTSFGKFPDEVKDTAANKANGRTSVIAIDFRNQEFKLKVYTRITFKKFYIRAMEEG